MLNRAAGSSEHGSTQERKPEPGRNRWVIWLLMAFMISVYAWIASANLWQMGASRAEDAYYNRLVRGFRAGQLDLKIQIPDGLRELRNPYDPVANEPFRATLHDTSYYRGKIYLYFGITPALVLFWPFAVLTGTYLSHAQATVFFCAVGLFGSVALFLSIRRRYFPGPHVGLDAIGTLAVGFVTAVPVLLGRADIWEVPISCAYAFSVLSLGAVWQALHDDKRRGRWLAAASLCYGLALGARPSLLFGGLILIVPVIWGVRSLAKRGRAPWLEVFRLLAAAFGPVMCVGAGLLLYNFARFDQLGEFGQKYQLAGVEVARQKLFSVDYIAVNFRIYFLQPLRWSGDFPFAQGINEPPLPPGHLGVDGAFGALTNIPFLWLAGAACLAWRARRPEDRRDPLRWFIVAAVLFFTLSAATLCMFGGACDRYQAEFLPVLTLVAVVGLLELNRMLVAHFSVLMVAGVLLVFSAATHWLASYKSGPQAQITSGNHLASLGQLPLAIIQYRRALLTEPDSPHAHHGLGLALANSGNVAEAIGHYRLAVRNKPDFAESYNCLGVALLRQNQAGEAEREFAAALRVAPGMFEAHFGRAVALIALNRADDAIPHLEESLRLKPDFQRAHALLESLRNKGIPR